MQWYNLDKKEQSELIKAIPIAFEKQRIPVLDIEKEQLALDINRESHNTNTQSVVSYFDKKIPTEDL